MLLFLLLLFSLLIIVVANFLDYLKWFLHLSMQRSHKSINFLLLLLLFGIITEAGQKLLTAKCAPSQEALPAVVPFSIRIFIIMMKMLIMIITVWLVQESAYKALSVAARAVLIISAEAVSFIYCIMREVFCRRKSAKRRQTKRGWEEGGTDSVDVAMKYAYTLP